MKHERFRRDRGAQGFSLIELVVAIVVAGLLMSIGFGAMRDFGRRGRARRATQGLAWSVQVARTYAIRAGKPMSLVVDETKRDVLVRDTSGEVAYRRPFGPKSDFALKRLDLDLEGDSLVFSRRGLCMNCRSGAPTNFYIETLEQEYTLEVSLLGRTEIKRRKE